MDAVFIYIINIVGRGGRGLLMVFVFGWIFFLGKWKILIGIVCVYIPQ